MLLDKDERISTPRGLVAGRPLSLDDFPAPGRASYLRNFRFNVPKIDPPS